MLLKGIKMINYKGLRDCHLNIFWQYDGKPYLENNITKAFINSIDSLTDTKKKEVLFSLFGIKVDCNKLDLEFYLQRKPSVSKIEEFDENKRIMFAFSPTGKCWGFNGQDTKNDKLLFEAIKKELSETYQDEEILINETKKALNEIIDSQRGDSIPDGWILVYVDDKPNYIIALENKRYNLDPFQINNHIEKSLLVSSSKKTVIYKKYRDIKDIFEKLKTFVTDQFIEYLVILGYFDVDDFKIAFSSDQDIRRRLTIPFGEKILSLIGDGKIDKRSLNGVRLHVKKFKYLREINLFFDEDIIKVSLAFGSTQNSGRKMLEKIDSITVSKDHLVNFKQSFHLIYFGWGKIIRSSYVDSNFSVNDYILYLKKNFDLIKTQTPQEAIVLYKKMFDDGFILQENYKRLKNYLENKRNKVTIVPEILIEYGWTYEEVSMMGLEVFAKELKNKINDTLVAMKL